MVVTNEGSGVIELAKEKAKDVTEEVHKQPPKDIITDNKGGCVSNVNLVETPIEFPGIKSSIFSHNNNNDISESKQISSMQNNQNNLEEKNKD